MATTVWLVRQGAETEVHVREFGRLAGFLQVDSCNHCDDLTSPNWEPTTRAAISSRLASDGLDKGRVLIARLIEFPSPALSPVSAATIHLDDRLVRLLHMGHSKKTIPAQREWSAKLLISCCAVIAREHGCARVEALLHSEAQAKTFCRDHLFRRVARHGKRYDNLRHNDYLVEKALE